MINDYGVQYRPIGAPGSIERVKVKRPKLIEIIRARFEDGDYCEILANDDLEIQNGITSEMERNSIIRAATE